MAKKRTTLPADFSEILERNDINELKALYEKFDINAYHKEYYKTPALSSFGISAAFVAWLVSNGANIESTDTKGVTPLLFHCGTINSDIVQTLISLGANIHAVDNKGNGVLHAARHRLKTVQILLENGANPLLKNTAGQTPLEMLLLYCENANITDTAKVAELYLSKGVKANAFAKKQVQKIGENFEFHRQNFNPDFLEETDEALAKLYQLFKVTPVEKRQMQSLSEPIVVAETSWEKQFEILWQKLVPSSGNANTVQGEVIRICGKVKREILDNGAVNWSKNYKKLPQALPTYFAMGERITEHDEMCQIAKSISANSDETELYRLAELCVKWVLNNPNPIALTQTQSVF
ncbi:MAG: ankyrin repeat domain-containing protein [Capnocytophaga sp.]|nr:ankyrin repeat domain-containing protein [Capnocytophaga sp.]